MPLPSFANAFQSNQSEDIEKTALYPRQVKPSGDNGSLSSPRKKGAGGGGLFDLLTRGGGDGGKGVGSSSLDKPAANITDILAYWQGVTKAAKEEQDKVGTRVESLLKQVRLDGFKQVSKAKSWPSRVFWAIMIVVILTALIYECVKCYSAYMNSPVTTQFTITTPPQMDFPNVYVCYGSAINRTYMLEHKDLMAIATAYRNRDAVTKKNPQQNKTKTKRSVAESSSHHRLMMEQEMIEFMEAHDRSEREAVAIDDGNEEDFQHRGMEDLMWRIRRDVSGGLKAVNGTKGLNRTEAEAAEKAAADDRIAAMLESSNISEVIYQFYQKAGFNLDETFLECSFEGYEKQMLNCKDIVRPVVDANYFLCYVVDIPDHMKQTTAGKGLNLVLNSHADLYPQDDAEQPPVYTGLVVSIDKDYNPFNWEKTCVTAGRVTKIDLSLTHVHLEDFDSGPLIQHCYNDERAGDVFKIFKGNYSRTTCQMDCVFQSHRNACDCVMLIDRSILKDDVANVTGFCSPTQFAECVGQLTSNDTAQKAVNACVANCYAPCDSYRYDMRPSYARLHEPAYSRFKLPANVTTRQLVDLRVAFSRMEYAELIQQPSASFADFVSNLGGQVNLWLSASLISLMQMGSMFLGLIIWSFYSKILHRTAKQETNNVVSGGGQR